MFLSYGGRVCLLKSLLALIPLFYMSLFKLPAKVEEEIRKIQLKFLWDWNKENKKIAWIKWERVHKEKEKGDWELRF